MYPSQAKTKSLTSSKTVYHSTPVVFGQEVDWSMMCSRYESGSLKGKSLWLWFPSKLTRRYSSILEDLSSGSMLKTWNMFNHLLTIERLAGAKVTKSINLLQVLGWEWVIFWHVHHLRRTVGKWGLHHPGEEAAKALHHNNIIRTILLHLSPKREKMWEFLCIQSASSKSLPLQVLLWFFLLFSK